MLDGVPGAGRNQWEKAKFSRLTGEAQEKDNKVGTFTSREQKKQTFFL